MSNTLLAHNPAVAQLEQEGYHVTLLSGYVVVNSIPYVTSGGDVAEGRLIIAVTISGDTVSVGDHQIEFMGQFPHTADGKKMDNILSESVTGNQLADGIVSNYRFSNKPTSGEALDDCYRKFKHYESLICREAQAINPDATARILKPIDRIDESIFRYADTNSTRAGITEQANKFRQYKVGIVGLGGTGSYVLDKVAKTAVAEIHLFDGDVFENHNAFRAPGAATIDDLKQRQNKVAYYFNIYDAMRTGIHIHEHYLAAENISELNGLDFVFICIDSGSSRKVIAEYLRLQKIPFVDTGIELTNRPDGNLLEATARTLLITPESPDEVMDFLSFGDIDDELYSTNIQVAEMNDINACQAVIEWKKHVGFYANDASDKFQMMYFTQDNKVVV
ncbi:MAG: ThiF family adenylyltransferase [Candidatus Saccharimonadales bacterium]